MALDLSVGFTQAEIEAILAAQKKVLLKLTSQLSDSGSAVTYRKIEDAEKLITACQRQLQALDPDTYGVKKGRIVQTEVGDAIA